MITIRPVSDLRNQLLKLKRPLKKERPSINKNGYGTMVVMSLEQYSALTEDVEAKRWSR